MRFDQMIICHEDIRGASLQLHWIQSPNNVDHGLALGAGTHEVCDNPFLIVKSLVLRNDISCLGSVLTFST